MKKIKRAIYSGTFDPITKGHLDIIKKSLNIFDSVTIAIANSDSKNPMFNINTRLKLVKMATKEFKKITVKSYGNLLADFAKEQNINTIIRGLRSSTDFEYEANMSYANLSLNKKLETVFLISSLKYSFISSSVVREIIKFNGNINKLVPNNIIGELKNVCSN